MIATAALVAEGWEPLLRASVQPVIEDPARMDRLVADVGHAFAYAEWLTGGRSRRCST